MIFLPYIVTWLSKDFKTTQSVAAVSNMESPTSTFLDLLKQYELSHRSTKKPVSDVHLELISRSYCEQWKSLPPYLKLESTMAKDIDRSPKNEREKRHDFLFEWKETKGSAATYKQLITALLQIKRRQDAEKVCELLKESICPKPLTPSDASNTACALPSTDTTGKPSSYSMWPRHSYINAGLLWQLSTDRWSDWQTWG